MSLLSFTECAHVKLISELIFEKHCDIAGRNIDCNVNFLGSNTERKLLELVYSVGHDLLVPSF
jgi:hypothetical protein